MVNTSEEKLQVLMQAARAVCYDQPHMIQEVTSSLPCLKDVVGTNKHGHAVMVDQVKFQELISAFCVPASKT